MVDVRNGYSQSPFIRLALSRFFIDCLYDPVNGMEDFLASTVNGVPPALWVVHFSVLLTWNDSRLMRGMVWVTRQELQICCIQRALCREHVKDAPPN